MRKLLVLLLLSLCLTGCASKKSSENEPLIELNELTAQTEESYNQQIQETDFVNDEEVCNSSSRTIYGEYNHKSIPITEIANYSDKEYVEEWENGISVDARVLIPDVQELNTYLYITKELNDGVRNKVINGVFEDGISLFEENPINQGYFEYQYGDRAGDYYLYHTLYPCAGPTIVGEEVFMLSNAAPNLYPFEDNILPESDSFSVIIKDFDPFDAAEQIIRGMDFYDGWEMQYFVPYGTQGRIPFFRVVYKMKQDNLYVNAYNDTYFLIDNGGIETFTGSLFELSKEGVVETIVPLEEAMNVLEERLCETQIIDYSNVVIDRITIEYVVVQEEDGNVSCFPVWRFYLSYAEYAGRENKNLICGVSMISGDFVYDERGFWF